MAALKWGICAAGLVSHDFTVGLRSLPETQHKVVAVASSSSLDSASAFAATHSIPKAYGSYQELAADPQVDIVYVGNLHGQHKEAALLMLGAGKHVLCEKPLTPFPQDTAALIAAAKEKNLFFMEGLWTRFFPAMVELRKRIADGEIGQVKFVSASFGFYNPNRSQRLTDPKMWGGATLDVGIYPLQLAVMVFGESPESVSATGWLGETGVDEGVAITLKFSGERMAQLTASTNLELPNEAVVAGTKGTIRIPSPMWCPTKLQTPSGDLEFPLPSPCLPTNFINSVGMRYEAEAVRECILAGVTESPVAPLQHTQILADIMSQVLESLGVKYQ